MRNYTVSDSTPGVVALFVYLFWIAATFCVLLIAIFAWIFGGMRAFEAVLKWLDEPVTPSQTEGNP